ncbi:hypothetical protein BGX28_009135 [Mortierella sp. GBA30]|nr:hypothetical protein BGX28_009135 [Mortierella sp. GBA30]
MTTGKNNAADDISSSISNNEINSSSGSGNNSDKSAAEQAGSVATAATSVLELKPLKNVMPIVPAQQVDSSSCPPSGESSPLIPSLPDGAQTTQGHVVDNDESGVENITQVPFA